MANFEARTSCSGGKLIKSKESVMELMARYHWTWEGHTKIEETPDGSYFTAYGYDWPEINMVLNYPESEDTEFPDVDEGDYMDEFFTELAPLLETPFILQCIGAEKCRFPLSAMQVIVYPDGRLSYSMWPSPEVSAHHHQLKERSETNDY